MKTRLSRIAIEEFKEMIAWIRERSPQGADTTVLHFHEATLEIEENPQVFSARKIEISPQKIHWIRRKNFGKNEQFCIFFEVLEDEILIHFVSRGARNLDSYLLRSIQDQEP